MARLTWTGWLGVVGLCLMLTLAVLPKTKWLLKLHGYVATGDLKVGRNLWGTDARETTIDSYDLLRLLRSNLPEGEKKDLANAILTVGIVDGDARRDKLALLSAKYPDSALVQAVACRYFSMASIPRPGKDGKFIPPKLPAKELAKRQHLYTQLVDIASRGIAADPENLYFDLILACAKCGQQRIDEAREIVRRASMKKSYNEYSWDECNLLLDLMKGSNDYGAYLRMQVYAGLVLPYYANMKNLAIDLMQTGTIEQKRQSSVDLLIVADAVTNKVDTLIGILVMRAVTGVALVNSFHHEKGEKPTDIEYRAAIDKLQPLADARFSKGSSPSLRSIYEKSNRFAEACKQYSEELDRKVSANDPAAYPLSPFSKIKLSLAVLLTMVFLIPASLIQLAGQKLRKHAGAARALPLLVPLFIMLMTQDFGEVLTGPNYTSLMALSFAGLIVAFVLAWFERFAKISFWIAMGVSAAGLLYGLYVAVVGFTPFSWTLLTSIATVASVFASQDKGNAWLRSILGGFLILVAAGSASLNLVLSSINNMEWIISIVILVLAAGVGPVRPNAGRRIVGPCILAASVVFALMCRQAVAIDEQANLTSKMFLTEVQQVRLKAQSLEK